VTPQPYSVEDMPPCTCNHDFWDGINFHFKGLCAKYEPVDEMCRFFRGWLKLTASNSRWLRQ
jgi:hypothetical protein